MGRFAKLVATTSALAFVLGVLQVSPASASVTISRQSCSSSSGCLDQTVDNSGEVCIVATKNASHHANWCIWDHGWTNTFLSVYVDGRAETCIGYQGCVGVDHFRWSSPGITLWALSGGHWYGIESGSKDIPSAGNTGPTDTLYTTGDYNYSGIHDCNSGASMGVYTHTEVDLKVFWTDGTNTTVITKNSNDYCHNQ